MIERIDERLQAMGVDASGMTDEQKFTAATGLTRYTEYEANNAWYVPGGAANVPAGAAEPTGTTEATGETEPTGTTEATGETEPTGTTEATGETEPTGTTEATGETEPTGTTEATGETEPTGTTEATGETEPTGTTEATGETEPTGATEATGETEPTGATEATGETEPTGPTGSTGEVITEDNNYYLFIGTETPENPNPAKSLVANANEAGWHNLGESIASYNAGNPAFNGGANTITLDPEFNDVECVVIIPTEMNIYDGMGAKDSSFVQQGIITINDKEYKVLTKTVAGEFGLNIF